MPRRSHFIDSLVKVCWYKMLKGNNLSLAVILITDKILYFLHYQLWCTNKFIYDWFKSGSNIRIKMLFNMVERIKLILCRKNKHFILPWLRHELTRVLIGSSLDFNILRLIYKRADFTSHFWSCEIKKKCYICLIYLWLNHKWSQRMRYYLLYAFVWTKQIFNNIYIFYELKYFFINCEHFKFMNILVIGLLWRVYLRLRNMNQSTIKPQ